MLGNRFHHFRRIFSGGDCDQHVEVAHGFLAAPQRTRRRNRVDWFSERANVRSDFFRYFLRDVDMESARGLLEDVCRFEDVDFTFFAEAWKIAQLALACQFFHFLNRPGLECAPQKGDFLGPERLQIQKAKYRFRIFLRSFFRRE